MMEGITVLNTIDHVIRGWGFTWVSGVLFAAAVVGVIMIIYGVTEYEDAFSMIGVLLAIFCTLFGLLVTSEGKVVNEYKTYEVIIDESVSLNEFTNCYEIVKQRGEIYEIKEKDVE